MTAVTIGLIQPTAIVRPDASAPVLLARSSPKIKAYRAGGEHKRLERLLAAWIGYAQWDDSRNLLIATGDPRKVEIGQNKLAAVKECSERRQSDEDSLL